jgi:hypothetical protein
MEGVDRIYLPEDRDQWWALLSMVIRIRVLWKAKNLTSWATRIFSRILFHEGRYLVYRCVGGELERRVPSSISLSSSPIRVKIKWTFVLVYLGISPWRVQRHYNKVSRLLRTHFPTWGWTREFCLQEAYDRAATSFGSCIARTHCHMFYPSHSGNYIICLSVFVNHQLLSPATYIV